MSAALLAGIFLVAGCGDGMDPMSAADESFAGLYKTGTVSPSCAKRNNNSTDKLLECVTLDGVRSHQAAFQAIADANGGIRSVGTSGYDQSVQYVVQKLTNAGYDVTVQDFDVNGWFILTPTTFRQVAPFATQYSLDTHFGTFSESPAGNITAPVTPVDLHLGPGNNSTSGCEPSDFVGFPVGNIALIQRGACDFASKVTNAEAAGATGVVIFNQGNSPDREGVTGATLGLGFGGGIPAVFASYALGVELSSIPGLQLQIAVNSVTNISTSNVFAETTSGDPNNVVMVGAHLDGVNVGPGIQDNGSGSAAILETALQMAKTKPRNKVRFAWWGAEELGLVGSDHYVNNLTPSELDGIALYLNFDMIASPNHVFYIYDGDDSDGVGAGPGPEGSAQIEDVFEAYYNKLSIPYKGTDFSGRSDYGPFIAWGIPSGGLFTGAEGIKTPEEVALWGGVAGEQHDPCYHLACDTYDNVNLSALAINSDAVAYATLYFAMSTEIVNGVKGKKSGWRPEHHSHSNAN